MSTDGSGINCKPKKWLWQSLAHWTDEFTGGTPSSRNVSKAAIPAKQPFQRGWWHVKAAVGESCRHLSMSVQQLLTDFIHGGGGGYEPFWVYRTYWVVSYKFIYFLSLMSSFLFLLYPHRREQETVILQFRRKLHKSLGAPMKFGRISPCKTELTCLPMNLSYLTP